MTCEGFVPYRPYGKPGPCAKTVGVRVVRWAVTPLRTKVFRGLCRFHEKQLQAGKLILAADADRAVAS